MESDQSDIEHQGVAEVDIETLRVAGSPRIAGEDAAHVVALTLAKDPLPPIVVHRGTMRVIDGRHRLRAAGLLGHSRIAVRFFDGDEADAFVLGVTLNIAHGLPLTAADRRLAAEHIITSHAHWSDRMIASAAGIAAATVAEIRKRVTPTRSPGDGARIGHDGRTRPLDASQGRRRAAEIIARDPDLSLRQIAREAGISPETVRDVRDRVRRGDDPLAGPARPTGAQRSLGLLGRSRPVGSSPHSRPTDRSAAVDRLKADPAMRFSATGRTLLRLLTIHTISSEDWDNIVENIPPHWGPVVAYLAGENSRIWSEFADRLQRNSSTIV